MKTCVRAGHIASRLWEAYNQRISPDGKNVKKNHFMIYFESREQCMLAGFGTMYEKFKKDGEIVADFPFGMPVKKYDDPDFEVARIREIKFDKTYPGMHYDCRHSKYSCHLSFVMLLPFLSMKFAFTNVTIGGHEIFNLSLHSGFVYDPNRDTLICKDVDGIQTHTCTQTNRPMFLIFIFHCILLHTFAFFSIKILRDVTKLILGQFRNVTQKNWPDDSDSGTRKKKSIQSLILYFRILHFHITQMFSS